MKQLCNSHALRVASLPGKGCALDFGACAIQSHSFSFNLIQTLGGDDHYRGQSIAAVV